jgi:hypothetical protein
MPPFSGFNEVTPHPTGERSIVTEATPEDSSETHALITEKSFPSFRIYTGCRGAFYNRIHKVLFERKIKFRWQSSLLINRGNWFGFNTSQLEDYLFSIVLSVPETASLYFPASVIEFQPKSLESIYAEITVPTGVSAPPQARFLQAHGDRRGLLADATGKKDMPSNRITRYDEILKYLFLMFIITP